MKDTSGPAFPIETDNIIDFGMTRRELIAMGQMKALRTIFTAMAPKDLAKKAILDANALLAELEKE